MENKIYETDLLMHTGYFQIVLLQQTIFFMKYKDTHPCVHDK